MRAFEERVIDELRAESNLVPRAAPAPLPQPVPRWPRYLTAAAAIAAVVVGSLWLFNRPAGPVASSVTVVSVFGDSEAEVVDLWVDWWEAWAEVRETATVDEEGGGFTFLPFEDLATDREVFFEAISRTLFTVEKGGGSVGVGEPTEIRLAPDIRIEERRATISDCVYLDPIPWPGLRNPGSMAGTARYTAEMELTSEGWLVSQINPEPLVEQLVAGPCRPGED